MNSQEIKNQLKKLFDPKLRAGENFDNLNDWYHQLEEQNEGNQVEAKKQAEAWVNIQAKTSSQSTNPSNKTIRNWLLRAAAVLIIGLLSYVLYGLLPEQTAVEVLTAGNYTNDIGKVSSFELPDGSKVWLSTGSILEYVEDFPFHREVTLSGEAFFEVKKDPDHPFRISVGTVNTEVLGTSFNLKSYDRENVELSVYSGRVKFSEKNLTAEPPVLLKGEKISWNLREGMSEVERFDTALLPGWRSGKISFENADLKYITQTLRRWYEVDIDLLGNGGKCHYSGEFTQASLEQILETLSYTLNLNYKIEDAHVTILANPCE